MFTTPPACVLWDHDGVLVDTEQWFFEATRRTVETYGIVLEREHWQACQAQGRGLVQVLADLSPEPLDLVEVRRVRDNWYERLLDTNDIAIPGAVDALRQIGEHCRMALVTTSLRRFIDQLHSASGLLDAFEVIVTAEDCERHKPDPEPYQTAMHRLNVQPGECVGVEDSPRGVGAVVAAGVPCVVVRSGFMSHYEFPDAEVVLDRIADLPRTLGLRSR